MFPIISFMSFEVYTYPLVVGIAWAFSYNECLRAQVHKKIKYFNFFFAAIFFSSWVGAKVLFLMVSSHLSGKLALSWQFWLGGGFVFYGGLIASFLFVVTYLKITNISFSILNKFVLPVAIGHSIGRVACLLGGCCYGSYCELPWAINVHGLSRHPVALYESVFIMTFYLYFRFMRQETPRRFALKYVVYYSLLRFCTEFFRGDELRGIWFNLVSTSQLVSIALVLVTSLYLHFASKKQ